MKLTGKKIKSMLLCMMLTMAMHIQTYYKESVVKEAIEKLDIFYK